MIRNLKLLYPHKLFSKVPYPVPPWGNEELEIFWGHFNGKKDYDVSWFEADIKKKLKTGSAVLFVDSGRHAIRHILRNLSFAEGSEVITPVLSCGVIPRAICDRGFVPAFADIGSDLCITVESIKKAMTAGTKAVILVHAGGAAASEYLAIVEYCKKNGLYLIDNAAQSWGNDIDGLYLGSRGDAGIVSFGIGKSTFGMGGGLLIAPSGKMNGLEKKADHSKAAFFGFYAQYFLRSYTLPFFTYANKFIAISDSGVVKEMADIDKMIQYSIFKRMDGLIRKRREISMTIIDILSSRDAVFVQKENPHVWTKLFVRLPEKLKNELQRYLYMSGIETEDYFLPHDHNEYWKEKARFAPGGYPEAERAYRELLILPNSPRLSEDQLQYLYRVLRECKDRYL
jgi:dTDP-4-amino-4,6-dideoxygalactose transaminase